jgi:lipoate-protein ligase A
MYQYTIVYHDLGNSCYTFIIPIYGDLAPLDTRSFNNLVIKEALHKIQINAEINDRNDVIVDNYKISGSAYRVSLGNKKQ